jgi:hypothetical protein
MPGRLCSFLFKGMKDENRVSQPCEIEDPKCAVAIFRAHSSAPADTSGIGRDNGIESRLPFCKPKIALPNSRRISSGKLFRIARAFGWKTAAFTNATVSDVGPRGQGSLLQLNAQTRRLRPPVGAPAAPLARPVTSTTRTWSIAILRRIFTQS